ncbi:MADF domain-containing protein [Camponotus japonicus]
MSPHVWSMKSTFELIRLYERNALLWDTKNENYRNREAKETIISNIAKHMNVSTAEIHRKLHNLRNQVCQELHRLKKKRSKSNKMCTSNWPYFSALKFLIPSVISRSRSPDISIQQMILEEKKYDQRDILNTMEDEQISTEKYEEKKEMKYLKSLDIINEAESMRSQISLSRVTNEDDRFCEWVALELRSLRSEINKRKLKSEIRKAICRIADLDDASIFASNPSSNSSLPYSSPVPSPTYLSLCEITNVKSEYII